MTSKEKKEDKVFDIAPASKRTPVTGSRPVIVGHKLEVKDPMVKDEEPTSEHIGPISKMAKTIMPIDASQTEVKTEDNTESVQPEETKETAEELAVVEQKPNGPEAQDKSQKPQEQKAEAQLVEKEKTAEEQEAEYQAKVDELVASKQYFIKVNAPNKSLGKKLLFPLIFLVLLAGAYLAVDAELIETDVKLPYHFFKKTEIAEDSVATTPIATQEVAEEPSIKKKEETPTQSTASPLITETDLLLQKVGDEKQLPEAVSSEFIAYMKQRLTDFECEEASGGITVKKVSKAFASGLVSCEGGYAVVWYVKDDKWQELRTQDSVECPDLVVSKIPSEFISTCIEDFEAETQVEKPNPNGSINS